MKLINKRLLITGVAVGIFICTLIVGIVQVKFSINEILNKEEDKPFKYYRILSQTGESMNGMNIEDVNSIMGLFPEDIETSYEASPIEPIKHLEVKYNNELISSKILTTNENYFNVVNMKIIKGRYFDKKEYDNDEKVCVIHENMYNQLGKKDDITLHIDGEAFKVVGVISGEPSEASAILNLPLTFIDEVIYMPHNTYFEYFMETEPENYGDIFTVIIKAPGTYTKESLNNIVSSYVSKKNWPGTLKLVEPDEETKKELANTMNTVGYILIVASLVLLLAGLNIVQITTANLHDIKKEIGLRMALGARRIDIVKEIAWDVILCTLKGGYIGVALYAALFYTVNKYMRDFSAFKEVLSPMLKQYTEYFRLTFNVETFITGILLSALLGVLSAVIPAIKSASIDPIAVLRKE